MKKIIWQFAAGMLLIALSQTASAQKGYLKLNLNYNYSMPTSAFKSDLVSDASPRGFTGSLLYSFNPKLEGGIEFGFQDYYQKYARTTYAISKTQEVSAVLSNSIQTTPVIIKAKYFPLETSAVKPFVSLGAGANIVDFKQYLGEFGSAQTNVGFMAQGGLGVFIPVGRTHATGFQLGATYDFSPYNHNGYHNLNTINVLGGITFRLD